MYKQDIENAFLHKGGKVKLKQRQVMLQDIYAESPLSLLQVMYIIPLDS